MAADRPEPKTIAVEGPATIYEVSALRETFRLALGGESDLRVDLRDSGKWDLAGLQLLISCVKAGDARGRRVRLTGVPKACTETAERSGLSAWLESVVD
jgi:ABC-type transporter Mla MlaB component